MLQRSSVSADLAQALGDLLSPDRAARQAQAAWTIASEGAEVTARLMNLKDYGIKIGNPADVVVIDAKSAAEAVAINAPVLAAFKRGRQTVRRPRAKLLRPS